VERKGRRSELPDQHTVKPWFKIGKRKRAVLEEKGKDIGAIFYRRPAARH